jgi:hypothetical protein
MKPTLAFDVSLATVADALRTVNGSAVVETGPLGSATSLFLRGGESNMVRVLLDGVPFNDPFGGWVYWSRVPREDASRIEVVDGSDILHSVTGREEKALNFFDTMDLPYAIQDQIPGDYIEDAFVINFGRWLGDRQCYLDPKKFTNPQLRLTSAMTISGTAGLVTNTTSLTVIARVIDDTPPPPLGFILSKEVYNWTTLASGDMRIPLPRDRAYKAVMLSDLLTTVEPQTSITNIKLTVDNDRWIPYNMKTEHLMMKNLQDYGLAAEDIRILKDTTFTWLSNIFYKTQCYPGMTGATAKAQCTVVAGESCTGIMTTGETAAIKFRVRGMCPHSSLYLPFGDSRTPEDFLDPSGTAALDLIATQGGAGADGRVVVQQLRV